MTREEAKREMLFAKREVMADSYIDKAYDVAIKALEQPDIIRCKDCKHRPKATRESEGINYGYSVVFPDEECPYYCEDAWYNLYPEDDFYCGRAERREEGETDG